MRVDTHDNRQLQQFVYYTRNSIVGLETLGSQFVILGQQTDRQLG
jgi:hypothetical protein